MGWHNEIASQRSFGPTPGSRGKGRARGRQGREVAGKSEERRRPRDREDRRVDQRLDQDRRVRRGGFEKPPTVQRGPPHPRAAFFGEHRSGTPVLPARAAENTS